MCSLLSYDWEILILPKVMFLEEVYEQDILSVHVFVLYCSRDFFR